jgi:spermidine/putrescine transport system ATP-binding protein
MRAGRAIQGDHERGSAKPPESIETRTLTTAPSLPELKSQPAVAAATADDIAVRLVGITKRFGAVTVLDGIDLDIRQGEFLSILGPSGGGKTTTMRLIGGFEQPTSGRVEINGVDVAGLPPFKRDVNTVFQSYALFPHMTVEENVAYGLRMQGVGKADRRRRAGEMLELVQLQPARLRRPAQLSGGMQQRVALARALVNEPSVLLLDEPLGALDRQLREDMQIELRRIQQQVGITFVYVTHDQEEALSMSDRLVVMRAGRIEQIGTPAEVYDSPASLWVGGFVGTSSQLHGRVTAVDGDRVTLSSPLGTFVATNRHGALAAGGSATLTVRPESFTLADRSGENALSIVIESVLNFGAVLKIVAKAIDGTELTMRLPRTDHRAAELAPGRHTAVTFRPQDAHAYPPPPTTSAALSPLSQPASLPAV